MLKQRLGALALTLCGVMAHGPVGVSTAAADTGPADAGAADASTVTFGARIDARPLSFRSEGLFQGYTIDICEAVKAKLAELDPTIQIADGYVGVTVADRLEKLDTGEVDILCGAFTQNVARMKTYDFSYLIFVSGTSVVSRRQQGAGVLQRYDPAGKENLRVVVVADTTTDEYASRKLPVSWQITYAKTHGTAWQKLERGEVELYYGDRVILRERINRAGRPGDYLLHRGFLTYEPYALPIRRDAPPALLDAANLAIVELFRTGQVLQIYERHFGGATERSNLLDSLFDLYAIPD